MGVPYRFIQRALAVRINAITGTTTAQLEAAYTTSPLTSTQVGSPIFSFTPIIDLVMIAEGRFVTAIANSAHPDRSYLRGLTSGVANEAAIPIVTSGGVPVVGVPGNVYDAADRTPCVRRPLSEVITRSRNSGSFFRNETYWYAFNGRTAYHTRTSVIIEVCAYSEAAQRAVLVANGNMLLPDNLEGALVDEGLRQAFRDDEFTLQANQIGQVADKWLEIYRPAAAAAA